MQKLVILGLSLFSACFAQAREFTVLVYNVENLFDLDGVALYSDYVQPPEGDYGVDQFLNKLEGIRMSLAALNEGAGPEIILFQEFETDRTPWSTISSDDFLKNYEGRVLEDLLEEEPDVLRYPVEVLLLKYLVDSGMPEWTIAQGNPRLSENHPPHKNVVFSRFPVIETRQRDSYRARDLLEVHLDVEGHRLILLNNHWKSGASNPEMEAIRVQNAHVVRSRVKALLLENPEADILVGGDFNSHYNQVPAVRDLAESGVQHVLGSSGDELGIATETSLNLYNLWFELPEDERGSEVYRGRWGTLMQVLLSGGLYRGEDIRYLDNSFFRLILPGVNVERRWSIPLDWTNVGGGGGVSDHLPIGARFRVGSENSSTTAFSQESVTGYLPRVPFDQWGDELLPKSVELEGLSDASLIRRLGNLYLVEGTLLSTRPMTVQVAGREWGLWVPARNARRSIENLSEGATVRFVGMLDTFRGNLQFRVEDDSWLNP